MDWYHILSLHIIIKRNIILHLAPNVGGGKCNIFIGVGIYYILSINYSYKAHYILPTFYPDFYSKLKE